MFDQPFLGAALLGLPDQAVVRANTVLARWLGRPAGLCGMRWRDVLASGDEAPWARHVHDIVARAAAEVTFETMLIAEDGTPFPVQLHVSTSADGEALLVLVHRGGGSHAAAPVGAPEGSAEPAESLLRLLVEATPYGALAVSADGVIEMANAELARMFGYAPGALVGTGVEQLLPPEFAGGHRALRQSYFSASEPRVMGAGRSLMGRRRDGSTFPVEVGLAPVTLGARRAVLATVADVSARHAAEQVLRENERRFRELAEGLPQIIWTCGPDGAADFINRRWEDYTGTPPAEDLGHAWMQKLHPDDLVRLRQIGGGVTRAMADVRTELRLRGRDGGYRWFDTWARPVRDAAGDVVKWIGSSTDVHDLRTVQDQLAESEERLRLALFATSQGTFDMDLRSGSVVVSSHYAQMLGFGGPEALTHVSQIRALRHPDDDAAAQQLFEEYLARKRDSHEFELRMRRRDGQVIWIRSVGRVMARGADGRPVRLIGTHTDVTARKTAEDALSQERVLLRTLIDAIPDLVFTKDTEHRFQICNAAIVRHFGYRDEAEVRGKTARELFPDAFADKFDADDRRVLTEGVVFAENETSQNAAGKVGTYLTIKVPLRDPAGRIVGIVGLSRDVTTQEQAAVALRKSEEQLRRTVLELRRQTEALAARNDELTRIQSALDEAAKFNEAILGSVQVGIVVWDRQFVCIARNPYVAALTGVPNEDVVGRKLFESAPGLGAYGIQGLLDRALAGETVAIDRYLGRVRGTTRILGPDEPEDEGTDVVWAYVTFQPYRNARGDIVGIITSVLDATARHRAEREIRRLNAELEHRIRERTAELERANQELETFAYSVSHDLKAPLRGVDGYSRLLEEDYGSRLDAEGLQFLDNIRAGIGRMGTLIDDLLAYSRMERQRLEPRLLSLSQLVASLAEEFRAEADNGGVDLQVGLAGPMTFRGDPMGASIAIRNVLQNAFRFSRDAAPPVVRVSAEERPNAWVLCVSDNGIGFDMKFHDRIFEIFQRLQRVEDYPGTGVGLALVRKAMKRMGGRVWAQSAPGEGARFFLEFPK